MRISARAFVRSTLLLSFAAGLFAPNAVGGIVNISFQGSVNGPGTGINLPTGVASKDIFSGYFTYNPSVAISNGVYNFAGTNQNLLFSIPILNNTQTFSDQNNNVSPNNTFKIQITGTGKGATLTVSADMIATAGKSVTDTTVALVFTSTSATYTGGLPASMTAFDSTFAHTTGTFNWDPANVGIGGTITMIDGFSVPEPSSLVLAIVAMVICSSGLLISRRKAAGALQRG